MILNKTINEILKVITPGQLHIYEDDNKIVAEANALSYALGYDLIQALEQKASNYNKSEGCGCCTLTVPIPGDKKGASLQVYLKFHGHSKPSDNGYFLFIFKDLEFNEFMTVFNLIISDLDNNSQKRSVEVGIMNKARPEDN